VKRFRINRRTFLRGAAGTALALPWLEIMERPSAAADTTGRPCRYVFAYCCGSSIGHDRGDHFVPARTGMGYDLPEALELLGPTGFGVQDRVSVVSGLYVPWKYYDETPTEPATRSQTLHGGVLGPVLGGTSSHRSTFYVTDDGERVGSARMPDQSSDYAVGEAIGADSVFPVLNYALHRGHGQSYDGGEQISHETSPRQAYLALTGGSTRTDVEADLTRRDMLFRRRLSAIDLASEDAQRLGTRLGVEDQRRMDAYFTELRTMERQLQDLRDLETADTCIEVGDPGADPDDREMRMHLFNELIRMAFSCDLSRSVGLLYSNRQSDMNLGDHTGIDGEMHYLTHNGAAGGSGSYADKLNRQMAAMVGWQVGLFAHLVRLLADTSDGPGGSVLDETALVFVTEGGFGDDGYDTRGESNAHCSDNMAMLIAGGAGGLVGGKHVAARGTHPALVTTSAMHAVGAGDRLGEIEGTIPALFG